MLNAFAAVAAEEHTNAVNHWLTGGVALGILLALLAGLVIFGGGREHS